MKITKIRDLILCRVWWIQSKTVHTPSVSVCVCLALVRFWAEMNCAKLLNIGASGTGISTSGLVSASRALNSLEVKSNSGFVFSILSTVTQLFCSRETSHATKEKLNWLTTLSSADLHDCQTAKSWFKYFTYLKKPCEFQVVICIDFILLYRIHI